MCCNTYNLQYYNTNTTTRTSGSMCDTVRLALDNFVFFSSNTMGKHVHVRMTKYTKTHQRSESELTRSLRGINISIYFFERPTNRGMLTQIAYAVHAKHSHLCFFPRGGHGTPAEQKHRFGCFTCTA